MNSVKPLYNDPDVLRTLYQEEDMSIQEVADELNTSYGTIQRRLDKFDIETDPAHYPSPGTGRDHHNWVERATLVKTGKGYYEWREEVGGKKKSVRVARLLAVAEYGFDAVVGNDVHHKLGSRGSRSLFDFHQNIELLTPEEHGRVTANNEVEEINL